MLRTSTGVPAKFAAETILAAATTMKTLPVCTTARAATDPQRTRPPVCRAQYPRAKRRIAWSAITITLATPIAMRI